MEICMDTMSGLRTCQNVGFVPLRKMFFFLGQRPGATQALSDKWLGGLESILAGEARLARWMEL